MALFRCGNHELAFDHAKLNRKRASDATAAWIDNRPMSVTQIGHQQAQCVAMGRTRRGVVCKLELWPEARIPVDGLNIYYREAGSPTAPAVLLLHGFPTSSHMFRDLIPLLASHVHVVAPSIRWPG